METSVQGFVLSPQQKRRWSALLQGGDTGCAQAAIRIEGDLQPENLERAWSQVVARHEILRTTFRRLSGMKLPVQVVQEMAAVSIERIDFDAAEGSALEEHFRRELLRPFDLEQGPIARASLQRLSADRHVLLVAIHPLCADARTLELVVEEISAAYDTCTQGDRYEEEAFRYVQFSEWQNAVLEECLAEPDDDLVELYTLSRNPGPRLPWQLASSLPKPSNEPVRIELAPQETAELVRAAGNHGSSLASVLMASWQILLWRSSGEPHTVVGELQAFRDDPLLETALGLFAKFVPVHNELRPDLRLPEFLEQVEASRVRAKDLAAGFIWGDLEALDRGDAEAVPVGFEYRSWPEPACAGQVPFSISMQSATPDRCALELSCADFGDRLLLELRSEASSQRREDTERLVGQLRTVLLSIAEKSAALLAELDILSAVEREQILSSFSSAPSRLRVSCVHEAFEKQVELTPTAIAVSAGNERLTYRELNERANQLAHGLQAAGVVSDMPVPVLLDRSVDLVSALLGILKAGGAYVVIEPDQPTHRIALILEEARSSIVLTRKSLLERLPSEGPRALRLDSDWERMFAQQDRNNPRSRAAAESLAYIVFTSGSTGRPKGVAIEHRQILNYIEAIGRRIDFGAAASFAMVSTFAADLGNTMLFPALVTGGTLHVVPQEQATDPQALGEMFERYGIDYLKIVPSHLYALIGQSNGRSVLPQRSLILGGEAARWDLVERVCQLAPESRIFNHYGPSETTVGVLTYAVEPTRDPRSSSVPIGHPLDNVQAFILDEQLRLLPLWLPGEIHIGGANVGRGYWRRPDLTAASFVPDPYAKQAGSRLYRTGDLARVLPGREIEFLGRRDHQIKLHGYRIELGEVRAALSEFPGIGESVVVLARDENQRDVLVAYYTSHQPVQTGAVREFLGTRLIEAAIPSWFFRLKRVPLTANGKIDYAALPSLELIKKQAQRELVAPTNAVEEILAGIWSDLLGLASVGTHDNFFELGGHSLLATQLISRVRQVFEVELPLRTLFDAPTVSSLASRVDLSRQAESRPQPPPVRPRSQSEALPLSFAQERLWVMHQLEPDSPAYNMPMALRVTGPLKPTVLFLSLRELTRKHEALRTTFVITQNGPEQIVAPEALLTFQLMALDALPGGARDKEAGRLIQEEALRPFDLSRGPLLRLRLLRLAEEEHVVLLTIHHIVADAWSLNVLVRELIATYRALASGQPSPLQALAVQYADFALWQRGWLEGPTLDAEIEFWREQLAGAPELLDLPADFPRPPARSLHGANYFQSLPADLTKSVQALSRREGATLFMTLLAVFNVFIWRSTGQDDMVVGTDIANRNRVEVEEIIGFFINNLPLRTRLSGNPTFLQLLQRVRQATLAAYGHQDLPIDRLIKALRIKRDPSYTPLFQVLFVLQNAPASAPEIPDLSISFLPTQSGSAKFDLALFVRSAGDRLMLEWNYSTDLFLQSTVVKMSESFVELLQRICQSPDSRLDELESMTKVEMRQRSMDKTDRRESKLKKLKGVGRKSVDLDSLAPVKTEPLLQEKQLPLLVQPNTSGVDLIQWARDNRQMIEDSLCRNGALLFRGFDLSSIAQFESFASTIAPDLFGEYGDLPSEEQGQKVYRSTPYPADKTILFHNESSHMHRWPCKQWFYCVIPAQRGGETPIVDCRELYNRLPRPLANEFGGKGLLYVRNFIEGFDVSWQEFFRTSDRSVVERYCQNHGIEMEWRGDNLRTRQLCPAVIRHPKTGEMSFFNQIMLHHNYCLEPSVREAVRSLFSENDLPRNV